MGVTPNGGGYQPDFTGPTVYSNAWCITPWVYTRATRAWCIHQATRGFYISRPYSIQSKVFPILVPVDAVKEIRVGRNTDNLRSSDSCFEDVQEDCAFSVIWGEDYQCLDLIAPSPDEANIWVTGLMALTSGNCRKGSFNNLHDRDHYISSLISQNESKCKI